MKYSKSKIGYLTIIETLDSKAVTNQNVIIDDKLDNLRFRVGNFILDQIKKMKPDNQMVFWKTSIGQFCIYKESNLDYCFEPHKSKYNTIRTILEFAPKKGDIKKTIIKSRKTINKEYEGYEECPNCTQKGLLDYEIIRQDGKLKVCKKCYDFDKVLDKLDKKEKLTKAEIRSITH